MIHVGVLLILVVFYMAEDMIQVGVAADSSWRFVDFGCFLYGGGYDSSWGSS